MLPGESFFEDRYSLWIQHYPRFLSPTDEKSSSHLCEELLELVG